MQPKAIYISGKITGLPINEVDSKFSKAEDFIQSLGHKPVNPMKVLPFDPDLSWSDYMKADIKALCHCDAILLLSDWHDSPGARLELHIAASLGIQIYHECLAIPAATN